MDKVGSNPVPDWATRSEYKSLPFIAVALSRDLITTSIRSEGISWCFIIGAHEWSPMLSTIFRLLVVQGCNLELTPIQDSWPILRRKARSLLREYCQATCGFLPFWKAVSNVAGSLNKRLSMGWGLYWFRCGNRCCIFLRFHRRWLQQNVCLRNKPEAVYNVE
ncbi:hypothetical protein RF11_03614 [Thelohanellus kitauei]|uniref:Uncharacterized protein n=1 Tax=Thelohanellus kitauei TaxID=669202 RepID=A0A0C2J5S5_THEKT|nr:hypothetical protein RF11_03614 [Thelohanellus kitauei]